MGRSGPRPAKTERECLYALSVVVEIHYGHLPQDRSDGVLDT